MTTYSAQHLTCSVAVSTYVLESLLSSLLALPHHKVLLLTQPSCLWLIIFIRMKVYRTHITHSRPCPAARHSYSQAKHTAGARQNQVIENDLGKNQRSLVCFAAQNQVIFSDICPSLLDHFLPSATFRPVCSIYQSTRSPDGHHTHNQSSITFHWYWTKVMPTDLYQFGREPAFRVAALLPSYFYSREGHARAFYGAHTSRRPL